MATQVLSVQNGDDAFDIKHKYTDVYSLEGGSNSKRRMKFSSLVEKFRMSPHVDRHC